MSSCDLSIRFDRDDRSYAAGDEIRGELRVRANSDVKCKALAVELGWATHGAGNVDQGTLEVHTETGLHLMAGRETTHAFRFTAPDRPLTYHGQLLNVELRVSARLDVSWAIDPRTSEDVILVAGPRSRDAYLAEPPTFTQRPAGRLAKVLGWIFAPLIVVMVLMLLVLLVVIAPIILTVLLVLYLRKRLAERRVGRVELRVDAPEVHDGRGAVERIRSFEPRRGKVTRAISPGREFQVELQFMPSKAVEVEATATLVGEERCRSGHGSNAVTHKQRICEQTTTLAERREVQRGQPVYLRATIRPPEGTAYSFDSSDNHLEWWLDVRVDIPGWPDWTEKRKLRMLPA